jgi:hypothetical protein
MQRWVLGGPLIDGGVDPDKQPAPSGGTHRSKRLRLWVNWALVVLTVLGAAVVMLFVLGSVMSTAAFSEKQCPNLGPNGISFDVLFYGAPVAAALTIVVSFSPRSADGASWFRSSHWRCWSPTSPSLPSRSRSSSRHIRI